MKSKTYWSKVHDASWKEIGVFFAAVVLGVVFFELTDFFFMKWIGAHVASMWLRVMGNVYSVVQVLEGEVYVLPLGACGAGGCVNNLVWFVKGCSPAPGVFPLVCFLVVPRSTYKRNARNYLLYAVFLTFLFEFMNAVEILLYSRGIPWHVAHNPSVNNAIVTCVACVSLLLLFKYWPETTIPFAKVGYFFHVKLKQRRISKNAPLEMV